MIMLVDQTTFKVIQRCRHDEEFFTYIISLKNRENERMAMDLQYVGVKWGFTRYSHKFLKDFVENSDPEAFREVAAQACRQNQDMLVIHKGQGETPLLLPVVSDLTVAQLKKDWCKAFAKDHGIIVITE